RFREIHQLLEEGVHLRGGGGFAEGIPAGPAERRVRGIGSAADRTGAPWLIAHREWVAPLPRADKRIDLGSLGESLLSAECLVPEPFRPRVRDLGRDQVAQEVLFGLMLPAHDPGRGLLAD